MKNGGSKGYFDKSASLLPGNTDHCTGTIYMLIKAFQLLVSLGDLALLTSISKLEGEHGKPISSFFLLTSPFKLFCPFMQRVF